MRRRGARGESPLGRAVGRAPVGVRTKPLIAFIGIAALLVMVAVLGLRVLGQSNARVEKLGTLQLRAATYQSLQTQASELANVVTLFKLSSEQQMSFNAQMSATILESQPTLAPRPAPKPPLVHARSRALARPLDTVRAQGAGRGRQSQTRGLGPLHGSATLSRNLSRVFSTPTLAHLRRIQARKGHTQTAAPATQRRTEP